MSVTTGADLILNKQLCHRLYIVSNALTRSYRPLLSKLKLTYPQYLIMMALWENDDIYISQLHYKTHIDIGSLSMILKKMSANSLINIVTCANDARKKKIILTKTGRQLKEQAILERCAVSNIPKGLSKHEFDTLITLLDKIALLD